MKSVVAKLVVALVSVGILTNTSAAFAKNWRMRIWGKRNAVCQPACPATCLTDCRTPPCVCPNEYVDDEDPNDDRYFFIAAHYNDECKCNGGNCASPVQVVIVSDGFLDYPQYCEDSGVPCEYSSARSTGGPVKTLGIGLKTPKSPDVRPQFPEVARAKFVAEEFMSFERSKGVWVSAKVFIYYLPKHLHCKKPIDANNPTPCAGVDDCKDCTDCADCRQCQSETITFGFEVTDFGGEEPTFRVEHENVMSYPHVSDHVFYANTGQVTFPIVVAERSPTKPK